MPTKTTSATDLPDPAAVFASALSLWLEYKKRARDEKLNLSECFNGMDEFMRKLMRVANQFESWACLHINFTELNDVWPYLLEDRFGEVCSTVLSDDLAQFDESDCLRVAMRLRLPIILDDNLPLPIDITAPNPVAGSPFRDFKIQTVRDTIEYGDTVPYSADDEPFDEEFGNPYSSLYGICEDGTLEQIADRKTYSEAKHLVERLAPGISFPNSPTCISRPAPRRI